MKHSDQKSELHLETLFTQARKEVPSPSKALLDQILRNAQVQSQSKTRNRIHARTKQILHKINFLHNLDWIASIIGLTGATAFGLFFGIIIPGLETEIFKFLGLIPDITIDFMDPFEGLDFSYLE